MRVIVAFVAVLASHAPASADGWERLDGAAIRAALSARVLGYPDGAVQDFFVDGQTLYGETFGRWEARGDLYCVVWPPSDQWACYGVERDGLDVRFTDDAGGRTTGRYTDLQ